MESRTTELLTTAQVAELLHIRADSVVRKIKLGEIDAVRVGRRYLIRRETLEALLQPAIPTGEDNEARGTTSDEGRPR
jgi:excisionase family DNA binding protein